MMKFINIKTALLVATTLVFAACSDDDNYEPGPYAEGQGYYFPSTVSSSIELSNEATSFDVEVCRSVTGSATTATITATVVDEDTDEDVSSFFTIPSSVSFGANESSTTITITYDPELIGYDTFDISLSLEGTGETTPYGLSVYEFTAGVPASYEAKYVGTYEYSLFFVGDDPDLDLCQSTIDPTRWKIEHWCYDVDFNFTYDEETGEILVDDQEIGYEYGSYGMVYVDDLVDYTGGTDYGQSYYEDGTFYFAVVYYCSGGVFDYGYETFTLTDESEAAEVKAMSKVKAKSSKSKLEGLTLHTGKLPNKDFSKSVFK